MSDPEQQRLDELLERLVDGTIADAEREEVHLLVEDRPDLAERLANASHQQDLGGEWLARVKADRALIADESRWWVRAERIGGAGLFIAGIALSMAAPGLGALAITAGIGIAGWSFVRTRVRAAWKDPYRKIRR